MYKMALCTNIRNAFFFALTGSLLIFLSFSTPYWLINDDPAPNKKFTNLGLWQICLNMSDPKHLYDQRFVGCWWIPLEDFFFMREQLISPRKYIDIIS